MQAFASTRFGAWFFSKTLAPMDRGLSRVGTGIATVTVVVRYHEHAVTTSFVVDVTQT